MKRIWVVIVNIAIMLSMLTFVVVYSTIQSKETTARQIEHFESSTVTMEHVTKNYLEGEQRICDVWTHYINSENMTMEEAVSFIRISHVLPNASAHIVYRDTLDGLSTKPKIGTENDYNVSYKSLNLLNDVSWISPIGTSINISRAYTNKMTGDQSIAFCNFVTLQEGGQPREGILLRVLPVSELEEKWVFRQEEFQTAELAIIDSDGDYIIHAPSFKSSNFFEFYKSYNKIDAVASQEFFKKVVTSTGTFSMAVLHGEQCIVGYTPFDATGTWALLSMMPMSDLNVKTENWLLIGVTSSGLLILFIFDLIVMQNFNKKLQAAAKEAELASRAKTDFLSTMSHDIRTPMNAIIGLTTISEKNLGDEKLVAENPRQQSFAHAHQRYSGYFQGRKRQTELLPANVLHRRNRRKPHEFVSADDQGEEHRVQLPYQPHGQRISLRRPA